MYIAPCVRHYSKFCILSLSHTHTYIYAYMFMGFPGGSAVKNSPVNEGDADSILGSGRFPGEGNGNPFQYSCLGNPMDRGAWWATVHGVAKELNMI